MKISKKSKYNGQFKVGDRFGCYEVLDDKIYKNTKGKPYLNVKCIKCSFNKFEQIPVIKRKSNKCKRCWEHLTTTQKYPIGTTFGAWCRISNKIIKTKHRNSMIEVKCKCNLIKFVEISALLTGKSKKCKFCNYKQMSKNFMGYKNRKWCGIGPISGHYIIRTKNSAKKRKITYSLINQDLLNQWNKQKGICALSGLDLKFNTSSKNFDGNASLDRIDSSKGYIKGNIQRIHKDINKMKNNMTEKSFIKLCKQISNYNL